MRVTVINGSPKPGSNNTGVLAERFLRGMRETPGHDSVEFRLNTPGGMDEALKAAGRDECLLLAFPMYNFAMPAIVKEFIERLEPLKGKCAGRKIGFLVQYGFPEAIHARPLERYLEHLARLLGAEYLGMIIKGGCDTLTKAPENFNRKKLEGIEGIGRAFGKTGRFDAALLADYAKPETQSLASKLFAYVFALMANRFYWGAELKKNGVYGTSFARPYGK